VIGTEKAFGPFPISEGVIIKKYTIAWLVTQFNANTAPPTASKIEKP
jgi:hypothetical protein